MPRRQWSFRDLNPYLVGLASVGVIGVAVAIAFAVGLLHLLEQTYEVKAVFTDAAGARAGDDVRIAGVQVGRITDIEADRQHGNVVITFVVDDGVELGVDTRAELALTTLLGTKFIRLTGDVPPDGPFLADVPSDERVIPVERTQIPFDIFDLTTTATRNIQATDNERLNELIGSLADVTEGKQDEIGRLLHSVDTLAGAINARDAELRRLLDRGDELTALLAEKDETLVRLLDASRGVLGLLTERRTDVGDALRDGARFTGELSRLIGTHKSFLDSLLETLHPTLDAVDRHQDAVNRALAWLGPGTAGLTRAGGQGHWVDIYVRALGPDVLNVFDEAFGDGSGP